MTASLTGDTTASKTGSNYTITYDSSNKEYKAVVTLTQKTAGWQTSDVSTIGGVTPSGEPKTKITITLADGASAPTIACE